jgi:AraC-like DNA-binding protein
MTHGTVRERVSSVTPAGRTLAITEWRRDTGFPFTTSPCAPERAWLVSVYLSDVDDHRLWLDDDLVSSAPLRRGECSLIDLARAPVSAFGSPFHIAQFHVPDDAVGEARNGKGFPLAAPCTTTGDPVLFQLATLLVSDIDAARKQPAFTQCVLLAVTEHLALRYGGGRAEPRFVGGLAPWQLKKARTLLADAVAEGISVEDLADACCLSKGAFLRGFKRSTGTTPRQWLLDRRVDRARTLLCNTRLSLVEIASVAGFCDQAHFSRVFSSRVGVSPGAWRRVVGTKR